MPTSAPGSKASRGFTLIEVLMVLALLVLASVGATLALRDAGDTQLESEAQRLSSLLEAARAQSRTSGAPIVWQSEGAGFAFAGPGLTSSFPTQWLGPDAVVAQGTRPLRLGPEPVIGPQAIELRLVGRPERTLRLSTDGLRPFEVR